MNRPILIITIGYIIGIIWGLYFNKSIVFLYIIMLLLYYEITKKRKIKNKFKMFSVKRYFRYIKLFFKIKIIIIIIISSFISNNIVKYLNQKYEKLYSNVEDIQIEALVISNKEEQEFVNRYKVKVIEDKYKNTNLYIKIDKNINLEYGDKIKIKGEFEEPQSQRNYKGFDYKQYLKTLKIYGTIKVDTIEVKEKNCGNSINLLANKTFLKIKNNIEKTYNKEISSIILGVMLGYTDNIDKEIKEQFSESNISHVLAVSGMHIAYVIIISKKITEKVLGKRISYIVASFILIIYMYITGFSTSIVRAGIMGIITCMSFVFYRKSNTINNIAISSLIILVNNPYTLMSISFLLTYGGTLGIILFNSTIEKILKSIKIRNKKWKYLFVKIQRKSENIIKIISVLISAQIIIAPIMLIQFNTIGISFLITNLLLSFIIGIIVMGGFLQILISFISNQLGKILANFISIPIYGLILISKIGTKIPLGNFKVGTPNLNQIIIYYIIIYIVIYFYKLFHSQKLNSTQIRIKNIIYLIKYKIKPYKRKIKYIVVIIFFVILILSFFPKNLKLYFIDVGQGDSTLIITPSNQKILIDGGGSENYEVGKNTLVPYLLDRKINRIDYILISHFDQDHVGGIIELLEEVKVEKIIISKQIKITEQYIKLIKIAKYKNIKIIQVKKGDKLNIEPNLIIDILFPNTNQITDNAINNNSIVAKITYKNLKILFTGDIEEIAEKELIKLYKNNELRADILKVAHHGSKTSSTQEFLNLVKPKIALIGVGKNNNFGHPNKDVLERLKYIGTKVYRTDECGEIMISINKKCINLTTMVNNKTKEK